MLVIIICALIGGVWVWLESYNGDFWAFLGGAVAGVIVGFFIACFTGMAYDETAYKPIRTTPLASLGDGSGVEGHFFLGSGTVEDRLVYTWYEKVGDNSYVRKSVDAESSAIHYLSGDEKPHYVVSKEFYTTKGTFKPWGIVWDHGETGDSYYDFYVPRGSITQEYKLDNS